MTKKLSPAQRRALKAFGDAEVVVRQGGYGTVIFLGVGGRFVYRCQERTIEALIQVGLVNRVNGRDSFGLMYSHYNRAKAEEVMGG